ncbi:hypothetical protein CASFOL_002567 [Castilleja foliolosa]|uniref:Protein ACCUMULATION AND REPLICATION OF CHLOROPLASTS 3 n=1 Tax=Castilleja foliolosa TaxID=1961234 RepID=A0ABD3EI62_9LAMI
MNLLCLNTTGPHSHSRVSIASLPHVSLHRTRTKHESPSLWNSSSVAVKLSCSCVTSSDEISNNVHKNGSMREECEERVEVIVVGSRKDALLDFCSGSPFLSPVLRFWNVLGNDSEKGQLQQRFTSADSTPRTIHDFSAWQSSCKAVILVASAAYGSDHVTALEVLSNVKSGNGFVVGIILKPFRFEGRRRQDEVKDLLDKLKEQAKFCIVLDTNALLENDLLTLDEALKTSNNAVLMAMNAISILLSEEHVKVLSAKDSSSKELQLPEFREIFERYIEASIGFGSGHNVKTSLLRAINDCPFLGAVDCNDNNNVLHTVRKITKCNSEIIVSIVHESSLGPNTILATIIVFGYSTQQLAPRKGIFSSLGQHFPFIFNIFKKQYQQTDNYASSLDGPTENTGVLSGEIPQPSDEADEEIFSFRDDSSSDEREVELFDTNSDSSTYELNSEGTQVFKRELLTRGNLEPGYSNELSKRGTNFSEATALVDSVSIYKLPVGVKYPEKLKDTSLTSNTKGKVAWRVDDNEKNQHFAGPGPSMPWSGLPDIDFNNSVPSFNKRNSASNNKKQGVLSSRAASMLESERDSQKKWNRVVEMKYRGGTYRGRTQGGLPEGKGRLLLGDGSIYEGMWRYGKRSGLGTFYFNNGDVFQGSWRDDVMHGKGWIYFHTGDRWFANFWKGKANGEGRFYSKLGDVFFGHFKEGWRHGHFLHINVDGTRSQELWDEGELVSEKLLDSDAEDG